MPYHIGDILNIGRGDGNLQSAIPCLVVEVSPEDGRVTKAMVIDPRPEMAKEGFLLGQEDNEIYAVEWHWSLN